VLSAHLRGLFAVTGVSNDFKRILHVFEGGGLQFINVTQNFLIFIRKKCNKFRSSPNLKSYLHMRIKIILGGELSFLGTVSISCSLRSYTSVQIGRA